MSEDGAKGECPGDNNVCNHDGFKRARYFNGMLMTVKDFDDEQKYFIEKRRLHNRMLHGWGVVCGLKISPGHGNRKLNVSEGLALDCCGNEIYVPGEVELDLDRMIRKAKETGNCDDKNNKWYLRIRYHQVATDPVPVYLQSDQCQEKTCDRTRIAEGYCFYMSQDGCTPPENAGPECRKAESAEKAYTTLCDKLLSACPGCCDDKGVVLGSVTLESGQAKVKQEMIDNWDCRRFVITFGLLQQWTQILGPVPAINLIGSYPKMAGKCANKEIAVNHLRKLCSGAKPQEPKE